MDFVLKRVTEENYSKFDDMVFWRTNGCECPPSDQPTPADIAKELKNPNLYIYAAESGGRYVGWISLIYIPKVGPWGGHGHVYVDELWVAPSFRNHGIAGALMAKSDELCEQLGAHGQRLYVNVNNPAALALYEKMGFAKDGQAYWMQK